MQNLKKNILIAVITIGTIAGAGYLAVHGLFYWMYNSNSCEFMNIDNIEVRTGIGINEISSCKCVLEDSGKTKKVIFNLDTANSESRFYFSHQLKPLSEVENVSFDGFLKAENETADFSNPTDMYYLEDTNKADTWKVLYNSKTGRLWITLNYRN